ncbi:hypothetical protein AtubIFM55763_000343 [Aspergillus tubingensis]|uniref:Uncharacterized protein n=1 Tax=Aspergillus tubingensis TaxID=5068 RepID=A0A8H3XZA9_ASPTU|nr:DEAD/DEAH box helicase family protein [Aspergillus tubingensis]GFN16311.1 DEAD/DEAH box helicase family protein [Aspergillus tubingensis]GLA66424.1 hypothetical protein AtubIFM54640_008996 [Aspergillus tubingensis]GLA68077.1 hypothetical protein AtubIFM55763_000343 [Aspergillus tubingensis]GLA85877.1 hypothetical protein AtubIFM56815_010124 [Aspergillus tubingensis]GLB15856.1 hypothetical protein AtubIFM61612_005688 [Aspergillus tubingensis]
MQHLPTEILGMIGKFIALDIDEDCERIRRSTLLALTLCCQKFHRIFEPLLYYHLDLGYAHSLTGAHIHLIIRFWRYPEVADWVRSLRLYWDSNEPIPIYKASHEDIERFVYLVPLALNKIFTPIDRFQGKWKNALYEFKTEAWIGLLFAKLTHLERIEFDQGNSPLFTTLLYKAAKREQPFHEAPPFPFLREVIAYCRDKGDGVDEHFLTPFLYFPSVQSITGYAICADDSSDEEEEIDSGIHGSRLSAGPVKQISLDEVWGCTGMLKWLKVCKELEHFSIEASLHPDMEDIEKLLDTRKLYQALLPFKDTLKSLSVTYDKEYNTCLYMNGGIGVCEDNIPFESFREFSALEHLTIRHAHLVSIFSHAAVKKPSIGRLVDRLPSSLQTLSVQDVLPDNSGLLTELLMVVQDRSLFPHLKSLELRDKPLDSPVSDDETIPDGTTVVGAAAGLNMALVKEEADREYADTERLRRECEARGIDMQWFMEGMSDSEDEGEVHNAGH